MAFFFKWTKIMNKREHKIHNLLKTLAQSGESAGNQQLAAAVVYNGNIVAFGQNSYKTHPFQKRFAKNEESVYLHAETLAIYNALKKLTLEELAKSTLYILRLKKTGETGLAKPCPGCARCINTFNIKKVYYTGNNPEEGFLLPK